jgi:16S rRNA (cytidine1402-2'-O)-methyltransferase
VIGREMTKKFEEIVRGDMTILIEHFSSKTIKGEFVVVVQGKVK